MKKILEIVFIVVLIVIYAFYYLSIELELKNGIENQAIKIGADRLILSSFRIREFATIQCVLVLIIVAYFIYVLMRKNGKPRNG